MKRKRLVVGCIIFTCLLLLVSGIIVYKRVSNGGIPSGIRSQVSFTLYYPAKALAGQQKIHVDTETIQYDAAAKGVSYIATMPPGANITVSQQATPDEFADVPEYRDKIFERMGIYSTIDTINGKARLTRKDAKSPQIAALNEKGTLLFAQPSTDLTNDQWRLFFNSLELHR